MDCERIDTNLSVSQAQDVPARTAPRLSYIHRTSVPSTGSNRLHVIALRRLRDMFLPRPIARWNMGAHGISRQWICARDVEDQARMAASCPAEVRVMTAQSGADEFSRLRLTRLGVDLHEVDRTQSLSENYAHFLDAALLGEILVVPAECPEFEALATIARSRGLGIWMVAGLQTKPLRGFNPRGLDGLITTDHGAMALMGKSNPAMAYWSLASSMRGKTLIAADEAIDLSAVGDSPKSDLNPQSRETNDAQFNGEVGRFLATLVCGGSIEHALTASNSLHLHIVDDDYKRRRLNDLARSDPR